MAFNHYAKIKRILSNHQGWRIVKINQPTKAKTFSGETRHFDYYYRILDKNNIAIPYCKFQQIDRFAKTMGTATETLIITDDDKKR